MINIRKLLNVGEESRLNLLPRRRRLSDSLFSCGCLHVNPIPPLNTTEFAFANGKLHRYLPFPKASFS